MLAFEPHHGLTHVLDKGLGPRAWEDVLEVAGDHISIVKLGWGTAAVTKNLERKLELIADFARDFTVLSEVGSKDSKVEYSAAQWVQWLQEELDAGAWKVITEARESGTAGIFDSSGGMRTELIGEIAMTVGPANVVFEAPTKAAQTWFIKQFGPSVNLGNIQESVVKAGHRAPSACPGHAPARRGRASCRARRCRR